MTVINPTELNGKGTCAGWRWATLVLLALTLTAGTASVYWQFGSLRGGFLRLAGRELDCSFPTEMLGPFAAGEIIRVRCELANLKRDTVHVIGHESGRVGFQDLPAFLGPLERRSFYLQCNTTGLNGENTFTCGVSTPPALNKAEIQLRARVIADEVVQIVRLGRVAAAQAFKRRFKIGNVPADHLLRCSTSQSGAKVQVIAAHNRELEIELEGVAPTLASDTDQMTDEVPIHLYFQNADVRHVLVRAFRLIVPAWIAPATVSINPLSHPDRRASFHVIYCSESAQRASLALVENVDSALQVRVDRNLPNSQTAISEQTFTISLQANEGVHSLREEIQLRGTSATGEVVVLSMLVLIDGFAQAAGR